MAESQRGINSFQLKLIALIFMTIDHFGVYATFGSNPLLYEALRTLGRVAAPLFLFLIVEGLRHTRSKPKYLLRLYLGGLLIGGVNLLVQRLTGSYQAAYLGNILPTFAYVVLYVMLLEKLVEGIRTRQARSILLAVGGILLTATPVALSYLDFYAGLLALVLPSPFLVEYSFLFVLLGVAWYFLKDKGKICLFFAAFCLCSLFIPYRAFYALPWFLGPAYFSAYVLFVPIQWCMVLALPFLLLYNGQKGRSCKYLFYLYYPLHQYALLLLQLYLLH